MSEDVIERTDIHTWFGLSYSSYLVLRSEHLSQTTAGPKIVAMLDELKRAFSHLQVPTYRVRIGQWYSLNEMSDEQLAAAGFQINTPTGEAVPAEEDLEATDGREVTYTDGTHSYEGYEDAFLPTSGGDLSPEATVVVNRSLLQSMPKQWQYDLVDLLRGHTEQAEELGFADLDEYKVEAGVVVDGEFVALAEDPIPHYNRGRTRIATTGQS